jgi:hypothetical protein
MLRLRSGSVLAASLLGVGYFAACSAEFDCPPGTAFEDCKASDIPNPGPRGGSSQVGNASGSSGSGGAGTGGTGAQGGTGSLGDAGRPPLAMAGMGGSAGSGGQSGDACPMDPAKTAPGQCGCGAVDTDFDGDMVADCIDECPDNNDRVAPTGPCGCSSFANTAACTELRTALRNLYTFDGSTTTITDSKGTRNGTLLDSTSTATTEALGRMQRGGRLELDGAGAFVQLPQGMISELTNATFEAWVAWNSGAAWQRIFDFGNNNGAGQTAGISYLFLTPQNSLTNTLRVAYSVAGPGANETLVDDNAPLLTGATTVQHLAVVIDDNANVMRLYLDGAEQGNTPLTGSLTAINDQNNWLGRSNFSVDPPYFGVLLEFRIYSQALTGPQISNSFQAGPGALSD